MDQVPEKLPGLFVSWITISRYWCDCDNAFDMFSAITPVINCQALLVGLYQFLGAKIEKIFMQLFKLKIR